MLYTYFIFKDILLRTLNLCFYTNFSIFAVKNIEKII